MAYCEIHPDETRQTAAAFWTRAHAWFTAHGITVQRVLTDNGGCYRSHLWRDTLAGLDVTHLRTRPYRPQTNGKVERFNRTMLNEWAYQRLFTSEKARRAAFPAWLHRYNHHRPHTALGGQPPITRCTNLSRAEQLAEHDALDGAVDLDTVEHEELGAAVVVPVECGDGVAEPPAAGTGTAVKLSAVVEQQPVGRVRAGGQVGHQGVEVQVAVAVGVAGRE